MMSDLERLEKVAIREKLKYPHLSLQEILEGIANCNSYALSEEARKKLVELKLMEARWKK